MRGNPVSWCCETSRYKGVRLIAMSSKFSRRQRKRAGRSLSLRTCYRIPKMPWSVDALPPEGEVRLRCVEYALETSPAAAEVVFHRSHATIDLTTEVATTAILIGVEQLLLISVGALGHSRFHRCHQRRHARRHSGRHLGGSFSAYRTSHHTDNRNHENLALNRYRYTR